MSKGSSRRPTLNKELAERNWAIYEQGRLQRLSKQAIQVGQVEAGKGKRSYEKKGGEL